MIIYQKLNSYDRPCIRNLFIFPLKENCKSSLPDSLRRTSPYLLRETNSTYQSTGPSLPTRDVRLTYRDR